ncbi:type II secretion system secretin GspD [Rhizobacter sp. Root1221]|uniref:type II secretion system secretin GspD n=1 Tax=Rhizobacter sp. Root1221 TaxID=1736433 RepID=UPI0012FCB43F|nr:type II secretion system secretin GspD [Rhizobacter sp. Root1221]
MNKRPLLSMPRRPLTTAVAVAMLFTTLAPVPAAFAQAPAKRSKAAEQQVTLNFVNAEIEGVARAIGAMLKQQFIVDPRVKGQITLYNEEPLTTREAYLNFLAALRGQGFTVVEAGGLYKVVPEADAKLQSGTVSVGAVSRRGDQIITQIFKINHENANNLVPVLRPLISPNNTINANPGNNTLIITDYADNLARIAKIISAMDTATTGDVEIITLKHVVAADLAPTIQRLSDAAATGQPGQPAGGGAGGSSAPAILVDSRSNSLIVRAPNPARMNAIRSLAEKLDRPSDNTSPMGNIYVVYLKNADATRLATVLRAAHGANSTGSSGAGGGSSGGASPSASNAPQNASANAAGGATQSTAPVAATAGPSTGGFIQADPATNSLIITAPEPLYRQLRAVIDQLDSRRAQVYIESMIVKVDANKVVDIGVQWQGPSGRNGDSKIYGAGTNFGTTGNIVTATAAIATGDLASAASQVGQGFNIGLLRKFGDIYTLGALARFLETNADGNVLSTPNLVSLDNEEAKIVIGQNVPFITGSYSNTGSGATTSPFQTIERKDVGLTLRVKPQIGENGTVRMTIYQENSSVVAGLTSSAGPTTDKSAIETTVVVDDGQIMVLGGLLKDEYTGSVSKVPLLGDIPYLGVLFRSDNRTRIKSNLMVFLRPVVMRDQQAATDLSLDRYDAIRAMQQRSAAPLKQESPVLPPYVAPTPGQPAPSIPPQLSESAPQVPRDPSTPPRPVAPPASAPTN